MELFAGTMPYLRTGAQSVPMVPGHEWVGTVSALGSGVAPAWRGRRVTGDTMLGCGHCERCLTGRHHVCDRRHEIGIRGNWPGALAERLLVPATALRALPAAGAGVCRREGSRGEHRKVADRTCLRVGPFSRRSRGGGLVDAVPGVFFRRGGRGWIEASMVVRMIPPPVVGSRRVLVWLARPRAAMRCAAA
ncbi:alcohol dehydrogenase catalytic domain-containing protein [Rugosimonospora acidiphila]|uniref:alcohol dehydrogenase catalytic domain-containing protein n=1 Tax=Rugosimonospora acidiphila TaxID=556531 RepID=UPI0031EEB796